jgi:molybdate transport system substrate-binding protein
MSKRRSHFLVRGPAEARALTRLVLVGLMAGSAVASAARAEDVTIAVAANFRGVLEALQSEFEAATPHRVAVTSASTGQLYAQIVNGAPFDILLAADQERPRLLAESGVGDASTVFTYAIGQLALWSRDEGLVTPATLMRLPDIPFRWLAVAEPEVAPYGAAAKQVLESLGFWDALEPRLVRGQNIAQTFAMAETRNAELGFIALSEALAYAGPASYAVVPPELYAPIRQDAILLRRAADNAGAAAFLDFIRSPAASEILGRYGYRSPAAPARP